MTKRQVINEIAGILKTTGQELCVTNFPGLRQPGRGFHAYCIRYDETAGTVLVYPWSGAKDGWEIPEKRVPKYDLTVLLDIVRFAGHF